ncbi:MAG: hypothetical protein ACI9N0_000780 [Ilumatobacter sp.]|jgi:hypothetical protein
MTDHDDVSDALRPLAGRSTASELAGLASDVNAMVAEFWMASDRPMSPTS